MLQEEELGGGEAISFETLKSAVVWRNLCSSWKREHRIERRENEGIE